MKLKKENSAITLIALIITIIVLLILAGVTITTLTGENGLLNRAKSAKETSQNTSIEENMTLADYETEIDEYITGARSTQTTKIECTSPAGNTWTKVVDYPIGYNMDNTIVKSIKILFNNDWYTNFNTTPISIRNDGIYMAESDGNLASKPMVVYLEKID